MPCLIPEICTIKEKQLLYLNNAIVDGHHALFCSSACFALRAPTTMQLPTLYTTRSTAYRIKKGVINVVLECMSKRILDEKGMKGSMKYVQEQMYEKWQEKWNATEKGRVTHE